MLSTMTTIEWNELFNQFLVGDVDLCFEGLNFTFDMKPCIYFMTLVIEAPYDRNIPKLYLRRKKIGE